MVLWSGGVESTSLLLRLLHETDWEVCAHFIYMENIEGRANYEDRAVENLLPLLQKVRAFEFTRSKVSLCDGKAVAWDYAVQYALGLAVLDYLRCGSILRAGCLEDDWEHYRNSVTGEYTLVRLDPTPGASHRRRAKLLAAGTDKSPDELAPYLPSYALPKACHMSYLGKVLSSLTWSCRTPIRGEACWKCHSCRERSAAINGTSFIPEVAAMLAAGNTFAGS